MKKYCILTGVDLSGDGATNGFKSMCLNCKSCHYSDEKDLYSCDNENVMEIGKKKILASVPDGFEIDTLTLKPMVLKDPTKKCKNHDFDMTSVIKFIGDYFMESSDSEKENASE